MRLPAAPMLSRATTSLPPLSAFAAEPKWDGFRALLSRSADGEVVLRSRQRTAMAVWFPELVAAASGLPGGALGLDGEVVLWAGGQLDFDRLLRRMNRTPSAAARMAVASPCHFVAFDILYREEDLTHRPYAERRAALEELFAGHVSPLFVLCPSTSDPAVAQEWLGWTAVGIEGLVFKRLDQPYLPGRRGWLKWRMRESSEAVVGAVTGPLSRPSSALLGRLDSSGLLRYAGRTTPLGRVAAAELAPLLTVSGPGHAWEGASFSAAWGSRETLQVVLVEPAVVAEVSADISVDTAGRWRNPVRFLRPRPDLTPTDAPRFGSGNEPASG